MLKVGSFDFVSVMLGRLVPSGCLQNLDAESVQKYSCCFDKYLLFDGKDDSERRLLMGEREV